MNTKLLHEQIYYGIFGIIFFISAKTTQIDIIETIYMIFYVIFIGYFIYLYFTTNKPNN